MSFSKRLLSGAPAPFVNSKNFRAITYTGNGGTQSITGVGFKPDFVWLKNRSQSNYAPRIFDSSRGATKRLQSSTTAAESTDSTSLTSFDSDGFTLGSDNYVNNNGDSFVAWCWKAGGGTTSSNSDGEITTNVQANQDAGFSIVTFDGIADPGEKRSFGHGLSNAPEFIWMKRRGSAQHPAVFAQNNGSWGYFDGTSSTSQLYDYASNITVSSTVIDIVDLAEWFADASSEYVYWCWHSVAGYSKIGTYTGNRPNDVIVQTGFEVGFVMIKAVDATDDWFIVDNKRGDNLLYANLNNAETSFTGVSFLSNGFMLNGSANSGGTNNSGTTFLYMAFAVDPDTEAPTLASSFDIQTYTGTGAARSVTGLGFSPSLIWGKNRDASEAHWIYDTMRGPNKVLESNSTIASTSVTNRLTGFESDGFTIGGDDGSINGSGVDYVAWAWKADDNEPTFIPEAGKKISLDHGASNYVAINAVSGSTGKYYFEVKFLGYTSANTLMVGLYTNGYAAGWQNTRSRSYYANSGKKYKGTTATNYGATFTTGDTIGVAVNGDDDEVTFYKNGTSQGLAFSGNEGDSSFGIQLSTGLYPCTAEIRFTSSEWQYSAPSGFTEWTAAKTAYDNGDITSSGGGFVFDNIDSIVSVNSNAGFSIVEATAPSSGVFPVPHGLSSALDFYFIKRLDSTGGWIVYSRDTGANKYILLNDNQPAVTDTNFWDNTHATSTVFTLNAGQSIVGGAKFIAYCFHSVTGYQKFGTYTGSTDGVTITTGFKPDFILIKCTSNVEHWAILDTRRGNFKVIKPNENDAESDSTLNTFTVSSTGFSFPSQSIADAMLNENGYDYLYWAVAKNVPSNTTLANSFKTVTYTGTGNSGLAVTGVGFRPDLIWIKNRDLVRDHNLSDSVQGPLKEITPNLNEAVENRSIISFDSDGFTLDNASGNYNASSSNYVAWCWKAGNTWQSNVDGTIQSVVNVNTANGFSIVKWNSTSSSSDTIGHGLSSKPTIVLYKKLSATGSWFLYTDLIDGSWDELVLNSSDAASDFAGTYATSTTFKSVTSSSGAEWITYCWHSVSGFSSMGTYTGNGSTTGPTVTTGFQPDFLLVKDATNNSTNWRIVDSVRGVDATDGSGLFPNLNIAEQTDGTQHAVEFQSNGFQIRNATSGWNNNNATHIYMAFKIN